MTERPLTRSTELAQRAARVIPVGSGAHTEGDIARTLQAAEDTLPALAARRVRSGRGESSATAGEFATAAIGTPH